MKHACTSVLLFVLSLAGSFPAIAQREADVARMYVWDRLTSEVFVQDASVLVLTQSEDGAVNISAMSTARPSVIEPAVVGTLEIVERVTLDTTVRHGASIFNSVAGVGFDLVAGVLRPMAGGEIYLIGSITTLSNEALDDAAGSAVSILTPLQTEDSLAVVRRNVANLIAYETKEPAVYEPMQGHDGEATRCGPTQADCRLSCRAGHSADMRRCYQDAGLDLAGPLGVILICGSSCPISGPLAVICLVGCGLIIGTETYEAITDLFACSSDATAAETACFGNCVTLPV